MKYSVKLFSTIALAALLLAPSCQEQIDSLDARLTDLEKRVSELEATCSQLNSDVATLKQAVSVLEGKIYVNAVNPIMQEGEETGYEIVFSDGNVSKIFHGLDGADAPVPGVTMLLDGQYYWTLDGELLLDAEGNPLKASAEDGITPEFTIIDGDWYVRYAGGDWTYYGQATGDSMFASATLDGNMLILVLAGGQVLRVPVGMELAISFDAVPSITATPGSTVSLGFTVTSSTGQADIDVIPTSGVKAKVESNGLQGTITMVLAANIDYVYDKVSVIVTNGFLTVLKKITFSYSGQIVITDETSALMTCRGGNFAVSFATDVAYNVTISDGGAPVDWIVQGPKAMTSITLDFVVSPNEGTTRTATITISSPESSDKAEFTVTQQGRTPSFTVISNGLTAKVPEISGNGLKGLVSWDGEVQEWSASQGKYFAQAGEHSAEYFVEGATGFSFSDLTDLTALNLVDF